MKNLKNCSFCSFSLCYNYTGKNVKIFLYNIFLSDCSILESVGLVVLHKFFAETFIIYFQITG
nr:MAG TPA: hypothetical protein [Caudoviricetes sp.]